MTWLSDARGELAAERILDAAAELFASQGVAGTDMAHIAAAAGCSRATLYRYFENRRELQVAFVHREARRVGGIVAEAARGGTLLDAVEAALREVRGAPALAAWFAPGEAGLTAELASSSEVIRSIVAGALGDPADPDVQLRAEWLVRVIVALLTLPSPDERALLERFVVPVLLNQGR
jgi:AcrR family transcriptional regulator